MLENDLEKSLYVCCCPSCLRCRGFNSSVLLAGEFWGSEDESLVVISRKTPPRSMMKPNQQRDFTATCPRCNGRNRLYWEQFGEYDVE